MRMSRRTCISFSAAAFNPATDFSYTGSYTLIDDGDDNWRIKFLTSGTLTFFAEPGNVDAFIAGGGGGGNYGGGGGGRTSNLQYTPTANTGYPVVIGGGGAGCTTPWSTAGSPGGTSSIFGTIANGGNGASAYSVGGGSGGCGGGECACPGGNGGSDGSNGGGTEGGAGQGTTTKAFADAAETAYCGGGGGGENKNTTAAGVGGVLGGGNGGRRYQAAPTPGTTNTGGGGGGGNANASGAAGGSGIVIIRNHRA